MLVTATKRSTLILSEPAPDARILSYNSEGIVYAVRYWVPSFANEVDCRDSALSEIDAALRAAMVPPPQRALQLVRSEEHTSELQSLMRISYAVFCLKKTKSQEYRQATNTRL